MGLVLSPVRQPFNFSAHRTQPPPAGTIVSDFRQFHKFSAVVIAWLVLAVVTDLAISFALVRYLRQSQTGFAATDDLLSKLTRRMSFLASGDRCNTEFFISVTIQTGLITGMTFYRIQMPLVLIMRIVIWATIDLAIFVSDSVIVCYHRDTDDCIASLTPSSSHMYVFDYRGTMTCLRLCLEYEPSLYFQHSPSQALRKLLNVILYVQVCVFFFQALIFGNIL